MSLICVELNRLMTDSKFKMLPGKRKDPRRYREEGKEMGQETEEHKQEMWKSQAGVLGN